MGGGPLSSRKFAGDNGQTKRVTTHPGEMLKEEFLVRRRRCGLRMAWVPPPMNLQVVHDPSKAVLAAKKQRKAA